MTFKKKTQISPKTIEEMRHNNVIPTKSAIVVKSGAEPDAGSTPRRSRTREKIIPRKIRLVDNSEKMVLIDQSLPSSEIIKMIGEKLGIKNSEEFSLQCGDQWLNPNQTLIDQNISDNSILDFKKKFFVADSLFTEFFGGKKAKKFALESEQIGGSVLSELKS